MKKFDPAASDSTPARREVKGGLPLYPKAATRQRRQRRAPRIIALVLVLIVGSASGIAAVRAASPLPAPRIALTVNDIDGESVSLPWPSSGESAVALADGGLLAAGPNADTVVPTASIAKLITILTVLQKYPLKAGEQGPVLTLTDTDVALHDQYRDQGGSTVAVAAGEQISQYQVLQAMLLPSANNMADTLATWAYGSMDGYRTAAQKLVGGLGMTKTTVGSDASGLSPTTTSTARDLITLAQAAYAQPVIREIAAQESADIPVAGTIYSTDLALGGATNGLKTGTSIEAGYCFVFSASHTFAGGQTKDFVGVIMNADTDTGRFDDARTLLSATYDNFVSRKVALKGQTLGSVTTPWGAGSPVVAAADLDTFIWRGDSVRVTTDTKPQAAGVPAGATVGDIKANGNSALLITKNAFAQPDIWWRIHR